MRLIKIKQNKESWIDQFRQSSKMTYQNTGAIDQLTPKIYKINK